MSHRRRLNWRKGHQVMGWLALAAGGCVGWVGGGEVASGGEVAKGLGGGEQGGGAGARWRGRGVASWGEVASGGKAGGGAFGS